MKFKVGDKVRVVFKPEVYSPGYVYNFGRVGKVIEVSSTWGYKVQYSDNPYDYGWWKFDSSLELVNEKESEVFYMVKREGSGVYGTKKHHETEEQAYAEAKRLAEQHPGHKFYVLKTVGYMEVKNPEAKKVEL